LRTKHVKHRSLLNVINRIVNAIAMELKW